MHNFSFAFLVKKQTNIALLLSAGLLKSKYTVNMYNRAEKEFFRWNET